MDNRYELDTPTPTSVTFVKRNLPKVTVAQRERALKETEYNMFSFPAGLVTVDFLSDSGTTTMTDLQWASLFLGDESYGRNKGYYVLLDAIRDTFERGDKPKKLINYFRSGETDIDKLLDEVYLVQEEGGFVNGGVAQLKRPNAFLVPQGRCAENLLFTTLGKVLAQKYPGRVFSIPSNGHFDTTEGNIIGNGAIPRNCFDETLINEVPEGGRYAKNPFKGNMDIPKLKEFIRTTGVENIPLIYMTITNNTVAGQPVSMANIKEVSRIAAEYDLPFMLDACRFAENAYFIKMNEDGYRDVSIPEIVKETFSYCDGFTISFKKDGMANIGGGLFFRDKGRFWSRFSTGEEDIGVKLKAMQICNYGNDSYGGMSGRDIFALASGLYEVTRFEYLDARIRQVQSLAEGFYREGLPVVLPAGGHGVYLDMKRFFDNKRRPEDFAAVGFSVELLRRYGIRISELGYFAFEYDKKSPEQQAEILDQVRFAVARNAYGKEHIEYTVAAVAALYRDRESIPNIRIARGKQLSLRHFQTGLEPV